jgi:L-alanine-DL-glutamate epimerase-like enolase superfamily enzyme
MTIRDIQIHQPAGLLRILTDTGAEGWCPGVGADTAAQVQALLRPALIGQDPLRREQLWQEMVRLSASAHRSPPVWGGVDVALWDLSGKAVGLPVFRMIGGFRERVPAYRRGRPLPDAAGFAAEAAEARGAGFRGYKDCCDLGAEGTLRAARAIREAVGPDFYLMHDGGGRYSDAEALRVGRGLEAQGYHWFEEPLRDPTWMRLRALAGALDLPVLASAGPGLRETAQALTLGAVDRVRAGAPRCGGITDLLKTARVAEAFGVNCEFASGDAGWDFVHAHVSGGVRNCDLFEARGTGEKEGGLIRNPLRVEQGDLVIPLGPGLGLELDWAEVERQTETVV